MTASWILHFGVPDRIERDLNADRPALRARPVGTSSLWMLGLILLTGAGLGLFIEVTALAGQNDVASSDLGVATGASISPRLWAERWAPPFSEPSSPRPCTTWRIPTCRPRCTRYDDVFLLTVAFMAISLALVVVMHEKPPSENTIEVA